MKLFNEINQEYDYEYLTPFWLHRSFVLEQALKILYETVVIGNTLQMIGNAKKYLKHIEQYNMICHGFQDTKSILEWGGGLGMMCNIIMRKYKNIKTYVIIDIPIMTYIQSRYFIFNKIKHHVITANSEKIQPGVNLMSLPFIEDMKFYPDMFLSTWGISESSRKSLAYGSKHRLFKCKHLLIAHNRHELPEFPDSPLYGIIDCIKVAIDDDNEYIFR